MDTIEEIKSTGLKATQPRMKILEIFQKSGQRHMAAEDVYRHLLAENADIGLATVYRVLMQFEQAGILTRSHFEATKAIYELRGEQHHDHLVCLDCGRVEEFFDPEIERRQSFNKKCASPLQSWRIQCGFKRRNGARRAAERFQCLLSPAP